MTLLYSPALLYWLDEATRGLSVDSAAQVRAEIRGHYESAVEAALGQGATSTQADEQAVASLGDAKATNRQYRKVLLTANEARLLSQSTEAFGARPWRRWKPAPPMRSTRSRASETLLAPAVAASAALLFAIAMTRGRSLFVWIVAASLAGLCLMAAARFLPVYTPGRARIFRTLRWATQIAIFVLAFGPILVGPMPSGPVLPNQIGALSVWLWTLIWLCTVCIVGRLEWIKTSLRRKLPVEKWPKALYL